MASSDSFNYDVFISYSHHNAKWVREWLLPPLEAAGITVCIDFRDFEPGAPSLTEMERAVMQSRKTLLVLTPSYIASDWTEFESILAQTLDPAARKRRLLPLLLEHCELPLRIRMITYLDFTRSDTVNFQLERLIAAIRTERATEQMNLAESQSREEAAEVSVVENGPMQISREYLPIKSYRELIGRQTQMEVALNALRDPTDHWIIAIDGMGGIGKTALARELADLALSERLFDAVVWESGKEEEFVGESIRQKPVSILTFEKVLDTIARQMCALDVLELKESKEEERIRKKEERVKMILKTRHPLIVLDNLDTAKEDQDELARKLSALLNPTKAVLTSRHKIKAEVFPISLRGLQQADAITFVSKEAQAKRVRRVAEATGDQLAKIADTAGGAPLALKLIVGQLAYLDLDHVLTNLRQARVDGPDYEFYKFVYRPSWRLLSDDAQKILVSLSHFPSIGGDRETVLSVSGVPDARFASCMNELWTTSLIEVGGALDKARYSLHPLTQYFVLADIVRSWE